MLLLRLRRFARSGFPLRRTLHVLLYWVMKLVSEAACYQMLPEFRQSFSTQQWQMGSCPNCQLSKSWKADCSADQSCLEGAGIFLPFAAGWTCGGSEKPHRKSSVCTARSSRFFHSVTRTKVHRSLRALSFTQVEALDYASESTVRLPGGPRRFVVPYGFVQSPLLTSLALAQKRDRSDFETASSF